jgi:hypothetical protein
MKKRTATARPIDDGDIYAVPLPDNEHGLRYAAVRVLAANRPSPATDPLHMVGLTAYFGRDLPDLENPALLEVLRLDGLRQTREPILVMCCGTFPAETIKVGNLPLSAAERCFPCAVGDGLAGPDGVIAGFPLVGPISPVRLGRDAWSQWRWRNDRVAFEAEMASLRSEPVAKASRVQAPRHPMSAGAFWKFIALLDWDKTGDDEAVVVPMVKALASSRVADIKAFAETLANRLYLLDTQRHAAQIGEGAWRGEGEGFSVDGFLYARCAAVANGRAFFERVLAKPRTMPKDLELEALLYVAGAAYKRRARREWDYETGCDYETFSNRKGWR